MPRRIALPKFDGPRPAEIHARLMAGPGRFDVRAEDDRAVLNIYDVIGFWGVSAVDVREALDGITAREILVRINSPGGDVFDGVAIYNDLVRHDARISVEVTGLAASAASIIAMAGDEIAIGDSAFMMIHNAWGFVIGNRHDMTGFAGVLERIDRALARAYARRTGKTPDEITSLMDDETWMTGAEAVAEKFADRIFEEVASGDEDSEAASAFDLGVYAHPPSAAMERFGGRAAARQDQQFGAALAGRRPTITPAASATRQQAMEDDMDLKDLTADQLKAERPDLVSEIADPAAAAARDSARAEGETVGREAGVEAERARILGIQALAEPGCEEIVAEMIADGATTPDQAAARILAAQRERRKAKLDATLGDDPGAGVRPSTDRGTGEKDAAALAAEARAMVKQAESEGRKLSIVDAVRQASQGA